MLWSKTPCRRHGFDPWVGKLPQRKKWQPTPIFLPEKSHGQKSLAGYSAWCHRVRYNLVSKQQQQFLLFEDKKLLKYFLVESII